MTTKICDLCAAQFTGGEVEGWMTVKWMPGLHLSPRHRFHQFLFREYCPKCAKKMMKAGNVDFTNVPTAAGYDTESSGTEFG